MKSVTMEPVFFLNMQMVVDELEDDYDVTFYEYGLDKQVLVSPEIYYGQKELETNILYIATSDIFEQNPIKKPNIKCLCIGKINEDLFLRDCPIIEVNGKVVWNRVFNLVQKCFVRYISWANRLLRIMDNGGGLYEMCVSAIEFFKNPLYIHDENFNILTMPMWVVGMNKFAVDETTGNISVPLKSLQKFKEDKEYIKTLSHKKAALWNPAGNAHRVMYINIWAYNQKYCGRVLIQELNTSFKPSDFVMAEYFGQMLTVAFERNLYKTENVTTFEEILENMFKGERYDDDYLEQRMRMVRWRPVSEYVCIAMEPDIEALDIISVKKICSTISMVLDKSFSFAVDNTIYTICNLSLSVTTLNTCIEKLTQLNDATDFIFGISNVFCEFMLFPEYCKLAKKTLELRKTMGKSDVCAKFSDYALEYIISHCQEEFDEKIVCSDSIRKLKKIDEIKKSDYLVTLKSYLNNGMQQTVTAAELNIHRSTLVYRLEKIEELVNLDLNDPDARLYAQISIKMLELGIRKM